MPTAVSGSMLPVGSSARSSGGMVDERARHADALLLAARDLVREAVGLLRQAHQAEDLGDLAADAAPRLADDLEGVGDVVVDRLVGQQLEVLEHAADVAPQQRHLAVAQGAEVAAGHEDAPRVGPQFLEDQLYEGRLARAGGPDQEHELTLADVTGEVLEADHVGVVDLGDVFEHDHGMRTPLSAAKRPNPDYGGPATAAQPRPHIRRAPRAWPCARRHEPADEAVAGLAASACRYRSREKGPTGGKQSLASQC